MADRETTELRVAMPTEDMAVIDGYCSGHGQDRTTVVRQILSEWSRKQLHAATVILRVAGRNPAATASDRRN